MAELASLLDLKGMSIDALTRAVDHAPGDAGTMAKAQTYALLAIALELKRFNDARQSP
jgi:hypothetical protein